MLKEVKYAGNQDRLLKVAENEVLGLRMLHDNFDPDWKAGQEPHGTMIFTDEPEPVVIPKKTPLELRVEALESKVSALEVKEV